MPDVYIHNLSPGYEATLQLYTRGTNTTVGSPITGTSSGSVYTFSGVPATGDYDGQLAGFSAVLGSRFPIRDCVAYPLLPWSIVDATITPTLTVPDAIDGLCNLLVATAVAGIRVWAKLASENNAVNGLLVADQVLEATTNGSGYAVLTLIRYGEFTAGGEYRIRVADGRNITHNLLVRMPDTSSANLEDLTPL